MAVGLQYAGICSTRVRVLRWRLTRVDRVMLSACYNTRGLCELMRNDDDESGKRRTMGHWRRAGHRVRSQQYLGILSDLWTLWSVVRIVIRHYLGNVEDSNIGKQCIGLDPIHDPALPLWGPPTVTTTTTTLRVSYKLPQSGVTAATTRSEE